MRHYLRAIAEVLGLAAAWFALMILGLAVMLGVTLAWGWVCYQVCGNSSWFGEMFLSPLYVAAGVTVIFIVYARAQELR